MKQTSFHTALKFAAHAAASKDIRYYLNGVLFEFTDNGHLFLVGTDGHRMAIVETKPVATLPAQSFIVPIDKVKLMLTMSKGTAHGNVSFEVTGLEGDPGRPPLFAVSGPGGWRVSTQGEDGKYPDWRRVARQGDQPNPQAEISMNADYIADACKACGAFGKRYAGVTITTYGDVFNSARVAPHTIEQADIVDAFCIVMPMRKQ